MIQFVRLSGLSACSALCACGAADPSAPPPPLVLVESLQARVQADELAAAFQRAVQSAFREVADTLVGRRYDRGLAIYLEVLDAERSLFAVQQQLIELRSVSLQNDVSSYAALGGAGTP